MKTRYLIPICLVHFALVLPQCSRKAQTMIFADQNSSLMLKEMRAIILEVDGKIVVQGIIGKPSSDDKALQSGDEVLMFNGKGISSITEFKAMYENLEEGDSFKIGIQRKMLKKVMSSVKGDIPEYLKRNVGTETINASSMSFNTSKGSLSVLSGLGFLLSDDGKHIKINKEMDALKTPGLDIELPDVGDIILSLNGEKYIHSQDLANAYNGFDEGSEITFEILSKGQTKTMRFKKPKAPARFMMKRSDSAPKN